MKNEVAAFMMRENNLHQSQVMMDEDVIAVVESEGKYVSSSRVWHRFLLIAISRICECTPCVGGRRSSRGRTFIFLGVQADVELAHEMFSELFLIIHGNAQTHYRNPVNRRSYCDGFAASVVERANEILEARKKTCESTALIFVGRKSLAIKKHTEGMNTSRPATMSDKQTPAYYHGKKDGSQANLNAQRKTKQVEAVRG